MKTRRILSVLLAVFLLVSLMPTALAAGHNGGSSTLATGDLNAYLVDQNGTQIGSTTISSSEFTWSHNNGSYDISKAVPTSPNGYRYVTAHANSATGTEISTFCYYNGSWYYYIANNSSSKSLQSIYFEYQSTGPVTVTLSFDANGGTEAAPESVSGLSGTSVTLPEYTGTRNGYTFLGWAEAATEFPGGKDGVTYRAVYAPGESYELSTDHTLYAAWGRTGDYTDNNSNQHNITKAVFYIRKDGTIPNEPGSYESADYTSGIEKTNAITTQHWIVDNDTTKPIKEGGNYVVNDVSNALLVLPSDDEIAGVYDGYDPSTQYVLWYVQKYQSTTSLGGNRYEYNWHIDGVLLDRQLVSISYDANVPAGVISTPAVPLGYQVSSGTEVTVGQSGQVGGNTITPTISGYTFLGWNTKADGTGTMYTPGNTFNLYVNTTLYAIWSKGDNMLVLNKIDGLGNALDGASFTISDGSTTTPFTAGSYTNRNILTDTVYTITETEAPAHYLGLEDSFSFIVSSNGSELTAYLCDENGDELTDEYLPANVELNYANNTVNITVTNVGYFYIFHTADVAGEATVVEVPIEPSQNGSWNDDDTYNIVNETTDGFLYGGYYKDYAGRGNYKTPTRVNEEYNLTDSVTYKGDQTSWVADDAYTESGFAMKPVAGTTYYLKEVPTTYIQPKIIYTYDRNTTPVNLLKQIYMVTAVDDKNYNYVGYDVADGNYVESVNDENVYETITVEQKVSWNSDEKTYQIYKIGDFFLNLTGYLNAQQYNGTVEANVKFDFTPFWVTLDRVKVTSNTVRTVDTGNGYYNTKTTDENGDTLSPLSVADNATTITTSRYTSGSADTTVSMACTLSLFSTFSIDWDEDVTETPTEPEIPDEPEDPIETEDPVEDETPAVAEYTITKVDGRNTVDTQTVEAGDQTGNITYPEKRGYVFAGWFADSKLKTPADFSNVQGDLTVYAKYISERSVIASAIVKYSWKNWNISASALASVTLDGSAYAEVGFTYEVNGETVRVTAASNGWSKRTYTAEWSLDGLENQKNVTVTPYWVTLDGTVVSGPATVLRLSSNTNVRR